MRMRRIVRSRYAMLSASINTSVSNGATAIPSSVSTETAAINSPSTAPANARAPRSSPLASRVLYTGTKDAESAPSPNRLRTMFGMRRATLYASASALSPKKRANRKPRTNPVRRLTRIPAPTTVAALPPRSLLTPSAPTTGRATPSEAALTEPTPSDPAPSGRPPVIWLTVRPTHPRLQAPPHAPVHCLASPATTQVRTARAPESNSTRVRATYPLA